MTDAPEPRGAGVVYGCPLAGNTYTESLYASARRLGMDVREGVWSGRWLLTHLHPGDTMHLHWPSFQYYAPRSRWRSSISLCRFMILCLLLRRRGVRLVWTAHNLYPHDGGKSEWMHRVARRFVVRVVDRIFVHGVVAGNIVREEFAIAPEALRVIPHGNWIGAYPNTVARAEARRRLGLPETAHVFLFLGLCKPYKGLEPLIEAIAALEPPALLVVAGKFPSAAYQAQIEALAARTGGDKVLIRPGFVDTADLQIYFNAADAVALPYREILTSGTAMLAMSFGRPVVAPRLGSLIELIDDSCGVLYDADDRDGLSSALAATRSRRFDKDTILARAAASTWEEAARALYDEHCGPVSRALPGREPAPLGP